MPDTRRRPPPGPDSSRIDDPEVRRAACRDPAGGHGRPAVHQLEIDALLEMMMEKHIGSIGDFGRR